MSGGRWVPRIASPLRRLLNRRTKAPRRVVRPVVKSPARLTWAADTYLFGCGNASQTTSKEGRASRAQSEVHGSPKHRARPSQTRPGGRVGVRGRAGHMRRAGRQHWGHQRCRRACRAHAARGLVRHSALAMPTDSVPGDTQSQAASRATKRTCSTAANRSMERVPSRWNERSDPATAARHRV